MKYTTHSEEETRAVAKEFAATLKGGEVIALQGNLGAGKTTFVRGVAEALGANGKIKSPTFAVVHEYETGSEEIERVVHLDLYRLEDPEELHNVGLEDLITEASVTFVEWPEKVGELIEYSHQIAIDHGCEDERTITIEEYAL